MRFAWTIQSTTTPLTITDSEGLERYHVKTVPDLAERLSFRSPDGEQLADIVRDSASGGFEVLIAGERTALVRLRGLVRVRCLIETPGGGLAVDGDVTSGNYELYANADPAAESLAEVRRTRVSGGFAPVHELEVIVADGEDPVRFLATVLGIEYLCDDRRGEWLNSLGRIPLPAVTRTRRSGRIRDES
jgi:hypothetical protein